jgi:hypothetical protein
MMKIKIGILLMVAAFPTPGFSSWGRENCDIVSESADPDPDDGIPFGLSDDELTAALKAAIAQYNRDDVAKKRLCTRNIRFFSEMTVGIPEGIAISQLPMTGSKWGVFIRPCIAGYDQPPGLTCPEGLSSGDKVTLDATGYVGPDGSSDCPIRIALGSKVAFQNLTIKVKNKKRAVCKADLIGTSSDPSVPLADLTSSYAYLYNVTIIGDVGGEPDPDEDGDGVIDSEDNCRTTPNADQTDGDSDGIGDLCDNCPAASNSDQKDTDGDGKGDVCDVEEDDDADDDGVIDEEDNCPDVPNPDQTDRDGDGVGSACDDAEEDNDDDNDDDNPPPPDTDGDSVPDATDNCPAVANPDQKDTDEDGVGDACEEAPAVSEEKKPDSFGCQLIK